MYVLAFAMVVSTLIYQSTSYSNAGLKSEVELSAVQDGQALISIHYGEGRQFWIANNTDQAVQITGSDVNPVDASSIGPARMQEFTIIGEPESLQNTVLTIEAEWQNGSAFIHSEIPQSNVDVILLELVEEDILEEAMDIGTDVEPEIVKELELEAPDEQEEVEKDKVDETQPDSE